VIWAELVLKTPFRLYIWLNFDSRNMVFGGSYFDERQKTSFSKLEAISKMQAPFKDKPTTTTADKARADKRSPPEYVGG
jgi:hypothetical protein